MIATPNIDLDSLTITQIMIDSDSNTVKLIDFGLCLFMDETRNDVTDICGSIEYMAPEAVSGTPFQPVKADAWALGVTAYALLFGEFPYSLDDVIRGRGHPYPPGVKYVPLPSNGRCQVLDDMRWRLSQILSFDPNERKSVKIFL